MFQKRERNLNARNESRSSRISRYLKIFWQINRRHKEKTTCLDYLLGFISVLLVLFIPLVPATVLWVKIDCPPCSTGLNPNLTATGIVLAAVAAFAGLLVPLHYSLSFDVAGALKRVPVEDSLKLNYAKALALIITSDAVTHMIAFFGFSALLYGVAILSKSLSFDPPLKCLPLYRLFYPIVVFLVLLRGFTTLKRALRTYIWQHEDDQLCFKRQHDEQLVDVYSVYCLFTIPSAILGLAWFLILIRTDPCIEILGPPAVLVLASYFLEWLMVRVLLRPVSLTLLLSQKRSTQGNPPEQI
ncbi:MAG: hypothetical protein ACETWD_04800 [Desulfatiglandales bacterium]